MLFAMEIEIILETTRFLSLVMNSGQYSFQNSMIIPALIIGTHIFVHGKTLTISKFWDKTKRVPRNDFVPYNCMDNPPRKENGSMVNLEFSMGCVLLMKNMVLIIVNWIHVKMYYELYIYSQKPQEDSFKSSIILTELPFFTIY